MHYLAKVHHYTYGPGILPPWASWLVALGLVILMVTVAYFIAKWATHV